MSINQEDKIMKSMHQNDAEKASILVHDFHYSLTKNSKTNCHPSYWSLSCPNCCWNCYSNHCCRCCSRYCPCCHYDYYRLNYCRSSACCSNYSNRSNSKNCGCPSSCLSSRG